MFRRKMFVVYIQKDEKKERLYFRARNVLQLVHYLWDYVDHDIALIKRLKRIYRKKDNFIEVL